MPLRRRGKHAAKAGSGVRRFDRQRKNTLKPISRRHELFGRSAHALEGHTIWVVARLSTWSPLSEESEIGSSLQSKTLRYLRMRLYCGRKAGAPSTSTVLGGVLLRLPWTSLGLDRYLKSVRGILPQKRIVDSLLARDASVLTPRQIKRHATTEEIA